jgi:3-oxoacyl-[acyl-carrier protein] reductase
MIEFNSMRVLVTGASKGIGAACARMFGSLGASVAVHYHHDQAGAQKVVTELIDAGRKAVAIQASLGVWSEAERLVDEAERALGGLDVAVLNHGIWKGAAIDEMTQAQYDEMMDVNLRGCMAAAGAVARRMKPRGSGRIIFIASTAGQRGEAMHSHYAASKGAIISLTKSLAPELAPHGILVNCVAPGWVDTPMSEGTLSDDKARAAVFATIPLGRVGTPEEIAGPVVFLASSAATFITGEILNVNGGAVLVG